MAVLEHKHQLAPDKKQKKQLGIFLWALVVLLLIVGVVANYYFSSVALALRLSGWIVLVCIVVLLVSKTSSGQKLWQFSKEARIELRKVVWPTREETIRTTMMVGAMVVAVSLVLWGIDSVLLSLVNWLSGRGG